MVNNSRSDCTSQNADKGNAKEKTHTNLVQNSTALPLHVVNKSAALLLSDSVTIGLDINSDVGSVGDTY